MGKRGHGKSRGKKSVKSNVDTDSPLPKSGTIPKYFANENAKGDLPAADKDLKKEETTLHNGVELPSGFLTPENTPTKGLSTSPTGNASLNCTLPYPLITTSEKVEEEQKETKLEDVRHSKSVIEESSSSLSTPKAQRCLQSQLDNGASTASSKKKRRRGKRGGKSASKNSKVQSTPVPKSQESSKMTSKQITDFFPVRRSDRRCKSSLQAEKKIELEEAILSHREDGLEVKEILGKGRGVVSTKPFRRGDFVVEYAGDLISIPEAKDREIEYKKDVSVGCYMYYFEHKNKKYCIDATRESGKLGRLLNHSRQGNCCTKLVDFGSRPYLILVAKNDIEAGEELLYDYGDRNRETLESHPWLAL